LNLRGRKWRKAGEECIMRSFITCALHHILLGWDKTVGHVARTGEMRNVHNILVGKPKEKRPLGRPGVDGRIILKLILGK